MIFYSDRNQIPVADIFFLQWFFPRQPLQSGAVCGKDFPAIITSKPMMIAGFMEMLTDTHVYISAVTQNATFPVKRIVSFFTCHVAGVPLSVTFVGLTNTNVRAREATNGA